MRIWDEAKHDIEHQAVVCRLNQTDKDAQPCEVIQLIRDDSVSACCDDEVLLAMHFCY